MPRYFSLDQIRVAQAFVAPVAPFVAHPLVQAFGERLGQAIGDRLGHDGVVVVVLGPEPVAQLLQADAGGHGEAAEMIGQRRSRFGAMKSAERSARLAAVLSASAGGGSGSAPARPARLVGVQFDIVAHGVGGKEAVDAARRDQVLLDDDDRAARWLRRRSDAPARRTSRARGCADRRPSTPRCGRTASSR